jgi:hypothetical protein
MKSNDIKVISKYLFLADIQLFPHQAELQGWTHWLLSLIARVLITNWRPNSGKLELQEVPQLLNWRFI